MAHVNTLLLTDEELKVLNDVVRQSKVTATAEEILLVKLGRSSSPLLDITLKIGSEWESRLNELNGDKTQSEVSPDKNPGQQNKPLNDSIDN